MKLRKSEILIILLVLLSFGIGFYFYPELPDKVASHWNAQGQVDGYMGKFWGAFLMPVISVAMLLLFIIIPRVDPKKENIEKFRSSFDAFIVLIFVFMLYIYSLTICWNLGHVFSFIRFILPAFAVLFYFAGDLIGKAKMNWSVGIRTPWTLSSELVWKKTHALGAKLFKATAVISLLGLLLEKYAIWLLLGPVILSVLIVFVYSYLEYQKEKKSPQNSV